MFVKKVFSGVYKMDYLTRIITLAGLMLTSSFAIADELVEGEWEGSVRMHEQAEQIAKFKVRQRSSGSKITMFYNSRPYQFENLVVNTDKMIFELDTGSDYSCELKRSREGSFDGECILETEEETRRIEINMQPPEVIETAVESDLELEVEEQPKDQSVEQPEEGKEPDEGVL